MLGALLLLPLSAFAPPAADGDFGRAQALWGEAMAAAEAGRIEEAIRGLRAAVPLYRSARRPVDEAGCLIQLADLERDRHFADAVRDLEAAIEVAHAAPAPEVEASGRAVLATVWYARGGFQQAESLAEAALPVFRAAGRRKDVRSLLEVLGQIELKLGRPAKAVVDLEEALRLDRELGASADVALFQHNLAIAYQESGRYQDALRLLREALASFATRRDPKAQGKTLNGLGTVYLKLGDDQQALDHLRQAEALFRSIGDVSDLWVARLGMAQAYGGMGRYREALALVEESIKTFRDLKEDGSLAVALSTVAGLYRHLGRMTEALERARESLALKRRLGDWTGEASALNNLASLEHDLGLYERALGYAEQSLALSRKAGDLQGETVALVNSAVIYAASGHAEEALARSEQALGIARATGDRATMAGILRFITTLLIPEHAEAALARIDEALALEKQAAAGRPAEASTLEVKGAVLLILGRSQEALALFSRTRELNRELGQKCEESLDQALIGLAQMASSQLTPARRSIETSLAAYKENRCASPLTNLQIALGIIYQRLELSDLAIGAFRDAVDSFESTLEDLRTDDLIGGLIGASTTPYPMLAGLLVKSGNGAAAFDVAERARGRALLRQLGSPHVDFRLGADSGLRAEEDALRGRLDVRRRQIQAEQRKPIGGRDQVLLSYLAGELDQDRRRYETLLIRMKQADPEYTSLVHAAPLTLPEVRRLLDGETTLVEYFVLDGETLAWVIERDSYQVVRLPIPARVLEPWVRQFRDRISTREPAAGLAAVLYRALVAPLAPHLHHPNLWIVPHGALHFLPFAALADQEQRPLLEAYTVAYLPSASVLPFVLAKRRAGGRRVLALGDPDGSLPYAAAETRAVARLFGVEPLLGPRATESALRARAPEADILHVAAHVVYDRARPLWSRIALARDATNDGDLEVHEVFGLDLRRASLVVLSGCDSGLARLDAGDDLVGLTRAFLYAGAPAVVTSLWPIDDEASAVLMQSFYRHQQQGDTTAGALRAAQLEVRREERWKSPYFWAAFSLTGDGRGGGFSPAERQPPPQ